MDPNNLGSIAIDMVYVNIVVYLVLLLRRMLSVLLARARKITSEITNIRASVGVIRDRNIDDGQK